MWLYIPDMNACATSPFAPEAALSTSASIWQCQALGRSLAWRGKPSPAPIWLRRWSKVPWLRRLCGAMPEPSRLVALEDAWIASLAEFPASRIPLPESGSDGMTSAISGQRSGASLSRPARGARSSKTCPAWSHPAGLPVSGETFAGWVLWLRQDSSARKRLVRAMAARGSSCSPSINLPSQGGGWPTATANDCNGSGPTLMRKDGKMRGDRLDYAAEQIWSTPRASDGEKGGPHQSFTAGGVPLPAMTARWPTPISLSFDGSHQPGNSRSGNKMLEIAANWPTIRAAEAGQYQYDRGDRGKRRPTLTGAVAIGPSLHPFRQMPSGETSLQPILSAFRRYRATTCSVMKSELRWLIRRSIRAEKQGWRRVFTRPSFRRRLNPRFVEWLMGWPDHWTQHASTGSACSAMALSRYRQRMRSALLALPLPGEPAMMQPDLFGEAR